ncbi:MAG: stress response translation initiation inhibitor YciH, partial [Bacteroidales bacterium]|nr:stress response translation initiation inhibitor YciH [Bacteroidales bacterium]
NNESRLVSSTDRGRIKADDTPPAAPAGDGIVRIRRETSGRKGKGVTTVSGVPIDDKALEQLAKQLKQLCGTGGTVKEHIIEIQGDHRDKIREALQKQGFTVKLAGG